MQIFDHHVAGARIDRSICGAEWWVQVRHGGGELRWSCKRLTNSPLYFANIIVHR
jgi:hypothetical protein